MSKVAKRSILPILLTGLAVMSFLALGFDDESSVVMADSICPGYNCFSSTTGSESSMCIWAREGDQSAATSNTSAWADLAGCHAEVTCPDMTTRTCTNPYTGKCIASYADNNPHVKCGSVVKSCS